MTQVEKIHGIEQSRVTKGMGGKGERVDTTEHISPCLAQADTENDLSRPTICLLSWFAFKNQTCF